MPTTKLLLPMLVTAALISAPLFPSFAVSAPQPPVPPCASGHHPGDPHAAGPMSPCSGHPTLSPEQQTQLQAIMKEHDATMHTLHSQLFIKEQVLKTLQHAANPDVKAISDTATEITVIRTQIREARAALNARLEKDFGFPPAPMPKRPPCDLHGPHHHHGGSVN